MATNLYEDNRRFGIVRPVMQAMPDWRIQVSDAVLYRVVGRPYLRGDRVCVPVVDSSGKPSSAMFTRDARVLMLTPEEQARLVEAEFGIVTDLG